MPSLCTISKRPTLRPKRPKLRGKAPPRDCSQKYLMNFIYLLKNGGRTLLGVFYGRPMSGTASNGRSHGACQGGQWDENTWRLRSCIYLYEAHTHTRLCVEARAEAQCAAPLISVNKFTAEGAQGCARTRVFAQAYARWTKCSFMHRAHWVDLILESKKK